MSLLVPLALAWGALMGLVVLFYILRPRSLRVEVPSIFLWRDLAQREQALTLWQRLRRHFLLFLQLLAILLLALVLARPERTAETLPQRHVVHVIDASASMSVAFGTSTRLEEAKAAALEQVGIIEPGDRLTVVSFGSQPAILAYQTRDVQTARDAVNGITQTATVGDTERALLLAVSLADSLPGSDVYLYTDGSFPTPAVPESLNTTVRFVRVGARADNQGISAFAVRRHLDSLEAFVQVQNYSAQSVTVPLAILADGQPLERHDLTLAPYPEPGSSLDLVFADFPAGISRVDAVLDHEDALAADDRTAAILMPPPVLRALLVSDTPFFLSTVFAPFPFLALDHVRPVEFRPSDVYDLYIFDGWLPPQLPPGNWLIFNPPAGSTLLPVSGEMLEPPLDYVAQDHRLMQFVDIRDLRVSRAQRMELPPWADELLGSNRGPLLFSGTIDGRRMVVFSFSLLQSNLPLRTAFPVLMGNIYQWLNPYRIQETVSHLQPQDIIELGLHPHADRLIVEKPGGARVSFVGRQRIPFSGTEDLGVYRVLHYAGEQEIYREVFIVSLQEMAETNVGAQIPALAGSGAAVPPVDLPVFQEIWRFLALIVLFILLFEWVWYHRVRT